MNLTDQTHYFQSIMKVVNEHNKFFLTRNIRVTISLLGIHIVFSTKLSKPVTEVHLDLTEHLANQATVDIPMYGDVKFKFKVVTTTNKKDDPDVFYGINLDAVVITIKVFHKYLDRFSIVNLTPITLCNHLNMRAMR